MRIAISGMFWSQPSVGSGQYLRGLFETLLRAAPEHEYVLLLPAYLTDHRPPTTDHRPGDLKIEDRESRIEDRRSSGRDRQSPALSCGEGSVVGRRSSVVVRTPFDCRSENLA